MPPAGGTGLSMSDVVLGCGRSPWAGRDRMGSAGHLGTSDEFDRAIADFADAYAEQTDRDHAALVTAVKTGASTPILGSDHLRT